MSTLLVSCPKCKAGLTGANFNLPRFTPCPGCGAPLQVEIFPAFFKRPVTGQGAEAVLIEGESSCFYHPQKKAIVPCDSCGRFLCALCDCQLKDGHFCPGCLDSNRKKKQIQGLDNVRVLHSRMALMLAVLPLFVTGLAALYIAVRYRKEPGSLVTPMRWAFTAALILGSLQTLGFIALFVTMGFAR